ncbi:MAG: hypothetical protein AAFZ38_02915 [Myxococcota bacterium]
MGIQYDREREAILKLNEAYRAQRLPANLSECLLEAGLEPKASVLVTLFPEEEGAFGGEVVRQDGRVFRFDYDWLNKPEMSFEETTEDFEGRLRRARPYHKESLAMELFREFKSNRVYRELTEKIGTKPRDLVFDPVEE